MNFSKILISFFLLVSFGPLEFALIATKTQSLGASMPVEGQCYITFTDQYFMCVPCQVHLPGGRCTWQGMAHPPVVHCTWQGTHTHLWFTVPFTSLCTKQDLIHYMYLVCTSPTALYCTYNNFSSSNILYLSIWYSFNCEFTPELCDFQLWIDSNALWL
jgi:hypothetical protein